MANQIASLPWAIDTASATDIASGYMLIAHFEFVGYALDTDNVVVHDTNGRVVWQANGLDNLAPVASEYIGTIQGLRVPTLSAGKLLVFIE